MSVDWASRLEFARDLAQAAGTLALKYFHQGGVQVEWKSDTSPVTVADRQAEELLRQGIAKSYPNDEILGEEFPDRPGDSGYRWILDPIDGTKAFVSGVPFWGVMVGLEYERRSVIGVVYVPALDEMVYAARDSGAWRVVGDDVPTPARVSKKRTLASSLFLTSEVKTYYQMGREATYLALQQESWQARTWGDCYGYLLVATGRAEVMVDPKMNVWDCAALQPILEEAGGTFTDWRGTPTIHGGEAIATNGHVQKEVMAIVRTHEPSER